MNYTKALDHVKHGNAWAVIYIGRNFTIDTFSRLCSSSSLCPLTVKVSNETIDGSTLHIQRDLSGKFRLHMA